MMSTEGVPAHIAQGSASPDHMVVHPQTPPERPDWCHNACTRQESRSAPWPRVNVGVFDEMSKHSAARCECCIAAYESLLSDVHCWRTRRYTAAVKSRPAGRTYCPTPTDTPPVRAARIACLRIQVDSCSRMRLISCCRCQLQRSLTASCGYLVLPPPPDPTSKPRHKQANDHTGSLRKSCDVIFDRGWLLDTVNDSSMTHSESHPWLWTVDAPGPFVSSCNCTIARPTLPRKLEDRHC